MLWLVRLKVRVQKQVGFQPRVGSFVANPGLKAAIPLGLKEREWIGGEGVSPRIPETAVFGPGAWLMNRSICGKAALLAGFDYRESVDTRRLRMTIPHAPRKDTPPTRARPWKIHDGLIPLVLMKV